MDINTKKTIEWAFFNYQSLNKTGEEQIADITESGVVQPYGRTNVFSGKISDTTVNKADRLDKRLNEYYWARVVENTRITFEFDIQSDIIRDRFEKKMRFKQLVKKYGNGYENTYLYHYRKIMNLAFEWACKYNLLRPEKSFYPQNFMG